MSEYMDRLERDAERYEAEAARERAERQRLTAEIHDLLAGPAPRTARPVLRVLQGGR